MATVVRSGRQTANILIPFTAICDKSMKALSLTLRLTPTHKVFLYIALNRSSFSVYQPNQNSTIASIVYNYIVPIYPHPNHLPIPIFLNCTLYLKMKYGVWIGLHT